MKYYGLTRRYHNDGLTPTFEIVWKELNFDSAYARYNEERINLPYDVNGRSVREYSFGVIQS